MGFSRTNGPRYETRESMIRDTSRFLTWALEADRGLPRIPTRRSKDGGFAALMRRPAARLMSAHWWHRAVDRAERVFGG